MTRRRSVSVEREKGFEPSTSTLARWSDGKNPRENSHVSVTGPVVPGHIGTHLGHSGVGERVGGSGSPPELRAFAAGDPIRVVDGRAKGDRGVIRSRAELVFGGEPMWIVDLARVGGERRTIRASYLVPDAGAP